MAAPNRPSETAYSQTSLRQGRIKSFHVLYPLIFPKGKRKRSDRKKFTFFCCENLLLSFKYNEQPNLYICERENSYLCGD